MKTRFLTVPALAFAALALNLSVIHEAEAQSWVTTNPLNNGRFEHTATLLPNGKVLAAGGTTGGYPGNYNALSSAELYDPTAGTWTATGSMAIGRISHTATLLADGKVLVAGGYIGAIPTSSAELYDPASGTWTNTGSLTTARWLHTAT